MVVIADSFERLNRLNDPARVHVEGRVPGTNLTEDSLLSVSTVSAIS
jgi:hypothetical protein